MGVYQRQLRDPPLREVLLLVLFYNEEVKRQEAKQLPQSSQLVNACVSGGGCIQTHTVGFKYTPLAVHILPLAQPPVPRPDVQLKQ